MKLWIAQGFGVGRIPLAPGTFGALAGLVWFGLLLTTGHLWSLVLGIVMSFFVSVWLCGVAEKLVGKKDPGSVVLDEITAMPACLVSWVVYREYKTGAFSGWDFFFSKANWLPMLGVFLAFRLFDIWKPWPVRQSQSLPGGWGITVDDFLASVYVNLLVLIVLLWTS